MDRTAPGLGSPLGRGIDSAGNPDENTRMHHNHRTAHAIAVAAFPLHAAPAAAVRPGRREPGSRRRQSPPGVHRRALFPRRQGREACRHSPIKTGERNSSPIARGSRAGPTPACSRTATPTTCGTSPIKQSPTPARRTASTGKSPRGAWSSTRAPRQQHGDRVRAAAAPLTAGTGPRCSSTRTPRRTAVPAHHPPERSRTTRTCSPRPTAFTVPSRKRTPSKYHPGPSPTPRLPERHLLDDRIGKYEAYMRRNIRTPAPRAAPSCAASPPPWTASRRCKTPRWW